MPKGVAGRRGERVVAVLLALAIPAMAQAADGRSRCWTALETKISGRDGRGTDSPYRGEELPDRYRRHPPAHLRIRPTRAWSAATLGRATRRTGSREGRGRHARATGAHDPPARPLDFLVVADHAENLGLAPLLMVKDPTLMATDFGKALRAKLDAGDPAGAWKLWSDSKARRQGPPRRSSGHLQDRVVAHHRNRREAQRTRPVHRLHRLRVDLEPRQEQPPPQRHLPGREAEGRHDHPLLELRLLRPRGPLEVDGHLRAEERREAAGHPAQRQPLERADVRRRHARRRRNPSTATTPSAAPAGSRSTRRPR